MHASWSLFCQSTSKTKDLNLRGHVRDPISILTQQELQLPRSSVTSWKLILLQLEAKLWAERRSVTQKATKRKEPVMALLPKRSQFLK
ncbi:hypothetical protein FKM82_009152 [Ascaphus truei]